MRTAGGGKCRERQEGDGNAAFGLTTTPEDLTRIYIYEITASGSSERGVETLRRAVIEGRRRRFLVERRYNASGETHENVYVYNPATVAIAECV